MSNQVEISNIALIRIGARILSSPDENVKSARVISQVWDFVRNVVLEAHPWKFANTIKELAETTEPANKWDYAFTLPTECMVPLIINADEDAEFERVGDELHTNESTCVLTFTQLITNTGLFSAHFVDTMSYRLAAEIALPLIGVGSKGQAVRKDMMNEYRAALVDAFDMDDAQNNEKMVTRPLPWISARS